MKNDDNMPNGRYGIRQTLIFRPHQKEGKSVGILSLIIYIAATG